ncbi:hypothetical protein [Paraburkholderia tropica]|uniref:hypothetical protein n=1 Tax=Paraburkholderia tropica TaxID=92647 RepID=UPI002ABDC05E|nr:hypothetical protein [Paraburkholderia tropica]
MRDKTIPYTLDRTGCNTHNGLPPLRTELQAAHDEMKFSMDYFAYAVCRTYDGEAWEVNTREGNFYSALDVRHPGRAEALAAGAIWLAEQCDRIPDAYELAFRRHWMERKLPTTDL